MKRFHIYKNHPIVIDLRDALVGSRLEADLIKLYGSSIGFLYPKTLLFSFGGVEESDLDQYLAQQTPVEERGPELHSQRHAYSHAGRGKWLPLLHALVQAVARRQQQLQVYLDLSTQHVLDEQMLAEILKVLASAGVRSSIICSGEQKDDLIRMVSQTEIALLCSPAEVRKALQAAIDDPTKSFAIELPHVLDLRAMEKCLTDTVMLPLAGTRNVLVLDLSRVRRVQFFPLLMTNVYMHCLSHAYGVLWKVDCSENQTIEAVLSRYGNFELNTHIVDYRGAKVARGSAEEIFGTRMFDESTQSAVVKEFEAYLGGVARRNEHLLAHITVRDQSRSFSYRRGHVRLPLYHFIEEVVHELVDNVTAHSGSVGFLCAQNSGRFLNLFLGDCGLGIRRGLLNNYDVSGVLGTEEDAMEAWFDLGSYLQYRKKERFGIEAGYGLMDTLSHVFTCKGKFLYRSGKSVGSFMNPVSRVNKPKIQGSQFTMCGIQYCILIPLAEDGYEHMPNTTEDFMTREY